MPQTQYLDVVVLPLALLLWLAPVPEVVAAWLRIIAVRGFTNSMASAGHPTGTKEGARGGLSRVTSLKLTQRTFDTGSSLSSPLYGPRDTLGRRSTSQLQPKSCSWCATMSFPVSSTPFSWQLNIQEQARDLAKLGN